VRHTIKSGIDKNDVYPEPKISEFRMNRFSGLIGNFKIDLLS
jgi:hypothetical protein